MPFVHIVNMQVWHICYDIKHLYACNYTDNIKFKWVKLIKNEYE